MNDLLRRFHYPLTYLLLALVCVIAMANRERREDLGVGSQLLVELSVPLQSMVTLPVRELQSFWNDYVWLVRVREENAHLKSELAQVKEENLQYREAIVSSERFQRLARFRERRDVPMVPADVVAQDLSAWFQSIMIDRGSTVGIRPGMPVITDSGVVGLVSGTTPRASKVLLVTDPQSRIDAYVQRSRARGTVRGRGEHRAAFEYVLREADLEVGDVLLTSGLGVVFPKGLVLGRVRELKRQPFGLFQVASIEPAVDFGRLEEVFVILEQRELPDPDSFAAVDEGLWIDAPANAEAPAEGGRGGPGEEGAELPAAPAERR